MPRTLVFASALALTACADGVIMPSDDCGKVDWYKLGYRDGSAAGRSELEGYARHCAGVKPDEAAYNQGLEKGQWEKAHRRF